MGTSVVSKTLVERGGTIRINENIHEDDPIRSLKTGSLIQLDAEELVAEYWLHSKGAAIPFWDGCNLEKTNNARKDHIFLSPETKSATFLVLTDLNKDRYFCHGWLTATQPDGTSKMYVGLFLYNMLFKCIKFSEEAD